MSHSPEPAPWPPILDDRAISGLHPEKVGYHAEATRLQRDLCKLRGQIKEVVVLLPRQTLEAFGRGEIKANVQYINQSF